MNIKIRMPGTLVILLGTLLWLLSYFVYDEVWYTCMIIIGVILLIRGILLIKIATTLNELQLKISNVKLIKGIVLVIIGICLIIPWTNSLVVMITSFITGFILLVILISNLIESANKLERLRKDLYLYIITLLIIAFGINGFGRIIALIISSLIICYGIVLFILECISYKRGNDNHRKITNDEILGTDYHVEDTEK